jgi:hypothetical protein
MKKYTASLQSVTPYSQGRHHTTEKLDREGHDAYAERTALEQLHVGPSGIYIPPMAFKKCLQDTARYLKLQIPGRGKETYTKNFTQGVLCPEPIFLRLSAEDVRIEKVFTWGDPNKKTGGRVWRYFPVIDAWEGILEIWVIDEIIVREVLQKHLALGGQITGIGTWRPQSGGMWGKFKVVAMEEHDVDV